MRTLSKTLFLVAGLGGLGGVASANGFYINEHDARETGRAGAGAATEDGPSSIVFNPGGIAIGEGTAISLGASLISAQASYTDTMNSKTDTNAPVAVVPQLFISSRVHDMIAVGIGFHLPFGLAISWPDTSPQAGEITKQSLRTYFITPTVGVNLHKQVPGLSFGVGVDLVPATVQLERSLFFGTEQGAAKLGGSAFGVGGRVGLMYRPPAQDKLSFGLTYRSQVNLDFSGTGDFDIAAPYRSQLPPDGDIKTTLKLPMSITGGVAVRPNDRLELEANVIWMNWSKFKTIDITLADGSHTISPENYENTVTVRIGAEYKLPKQKLAVRAGYIFDQTPIPTSTLSAQLPDINRHDVTAGATYSINKNLDAHLGLLLVIPGSRDASTKDVYMPLFKGTYDVTALVGSLGIDARFGK